MANKSKVTRKRVVKVDAVGQGHIHSSFNNIIISLTNASGEVISRHQPVKWVSKALRKTHPMQRNRQLTNVLALPTV